MGKIIDLTGRTFGKWKVIKLDGSRNGDRYWKCECACGNIRKVRTTALRNGTSKTCGCSLEYSRGTHGERKKRTAEYRAWEKMIERCNNPNHISYKNYGGRGIKVCKRWEDYNLFLEDMGRKPTPKHSIDRVNVDGNYEPSNCKWSNRFEQSTNTRISPKNKTGVTGVHLCKKTNKYRVTIGRDYKNYYKGSFETIEEAREVRRQAELKYWGKTSL